MAVLQNDADNPLTNSSARNEWELHLQPDDLITVVMFDGTEIYVSGEGHAIGANGESVGSA